MNRLFDEDLDHILAHTAGVWEALAGSTVFLTGGTGFVGIWLLESLLSANARGGAGVRAIVLTRDPEGFRAKAPHIAGHRALRLLGGDVRTFDFPECECRFVIHGATTQSYDGDIAGTRRVLEFARARGAERLLFTSSGAMYGKQPPAMTHIREEYGEADPVMPSEYGRAKRAAEALCAESAGRHGFAAVIARLFAFVGPHLPLDANYAVGNFVRDVLAGGPVRIAGDGTPYRSYLYAADLAVWLWTMLARGASARPYNVGSARALTIAELARVVVEATAPGMPIEIAGTAVPGATPARYVPDVTRAETDLGLRARIGVEEGVRRMYRWQARRGFTSALGPRPNG
jgi:dTDP-glucose 4,6-dehydratase